MTNSSLCTGDVERGVLVVTILAEQIRDPKTAYDLRDQINVLIDKFRPSDLVLDMGKVTFIGSVGFLAFLGVRRRLENGRIVLCSLSSSTHDVFAICRLIPTEAKGTAPFEVASDKQAALDQVGV